MWRRAIGLAAVAVACLAFVTPAMAWNTDELYGITTASPPHLVSFEPLGPTIDLSDDGAILGLTDPVVGFDISPRDGGMYLVTRSGTGVGNLFSLDPTTMSTTPIGQLTADPADTTLPYTTLITASYGADFNPQSNLLRLIGSGAAQNLRVDPTNARVITDTNISGGSIPAVAFHNNDNDLSTNTVEYVYEFGGDDWGKIATPNNGIYQKIADATFTSSSSDQAQLDEAPGGTMYTTHRVGVSAVQNLYTVSNLENTPNPTTFTLVGPVGVDLVGMSAAVVNLVGTDAQATTAGEGAGFARVTVTRRNAKGETLVNYSTANGTALAGTDYTPTTGSLDFKPGEVAKSIDVAITSDSADEPNKTFNLNLSLPPGAEALLALSPKTTVTIVDDDLAPVPPGPKPDRDADGKPDSTDNCPNVSNANQADGDGDGLGTVCDPVEVKALLGGRCANQRLGTAADESLVGTLAGDTLKGFAGDDSLFGTNGADCLSGGSGDDWLSGGPDNDTLRGDAGSDVLLGGAGNDNIAGGSGTSLIVRGGDGNDTINSKNGRAEKVDCGRGKDVLKADKRDKAKGCEKRK
jgi:hypothetical protein